MKIGFFGGSFNPPTNAHINLAKEALTQCDLDKLIFVPMGDTYQKKGLAKAEDRLNMLKLACKSAKEPRLEVSDIEIKENKKMQAIDAFRLIQTKYPNDTLFFIMGADNFINILNWKESQDLISKYQYIILERKEINLTQYIQEHIELKAHKENITILQNKHHKHTSSSKYRISKEKEIIPKEVLEYIQEKGIY